MTGIWASTPAPLAAAAERSEAVGDEPAWRELLEALMLELEPADASRLGQLLRESRAAWALLWPRPTPDADRALLVSDPLAGTAPGLARLGWRVTLLAPDEELAYVGPAESLAAARARATGAPLDVQTPDTIGERSFDAVLVEEAATPDASRTTEALARATGPGALLACTADNRLAYKGSSGHRADFRLTRPWTFVARLLGLERGEGRATLGAHRKRLARLADSEPGAVRAAALYPDRLDFSHAVDLDREGADLTLGPKERANRVKLAGYRAGLFATFTPSYGLWARRGGGAADRSRDAGDEPRQLDHLVGAAWQAVGGEGPAPTPEHVVATRGNSAVVLTAPAGPAAPHGLVLRVPLGHRAEVHGAANHAAVTWLRERFGDLPAPAPLAVLPAGGAAGLAVEVPVETRLDGLGAGQLSADPEAMARLTAEAAELLAALVTEPAATLDEAAFDELIGARFETVRRRAAVPATVAALDRMEDELRAACVGLAIPRVACHNDLRPKHLVARVTGGATRRGRLVGLVDWSSLDRRGLPLYDLVHLIASERAQLPGSSSAAAWAEIQDPARLSHAERSALEAYERALDLPPAWRAAITRAYPVLFGAMAETNWDYSRPRWLHRLFGIGDE